MNVKNKLAWHPRSSMQPYSITNETRDCSALANAWYQFRVNIITWQANKQWSSQYRLRCSYKCECFLFYSYVFMHVRANLCVSIGCPRQEQNIRGNKLSGVHDDRYHSTNKMWLFCTGLCVVPFSGEQYNLTVISPPSVALLVYMQVLTPLLVRLGGEYWWNGDSI